MLTMILNMANPHLLPLLMVYYRKCRREQCCLPKRSDSQSVWNQRFGGDDFDLSERYAVMMNTLFVTLLYSGGMPLLLPIAALTFLLTYLFDKISFLRLYRIPPRFDNSLAMYTTTLLPYAIFLHLAFALWFYSVPTLQQDTLITLERQSLSIYQYSSVSERIAGWSTLPTLILLILVGIYILFFRICSGLYRFFSAVDDTHLNTDSSKFVPYSVARRTVTLESYHPHSAPYWHDAFIRTPSRKMLKIPPPLHVLREQARQTALAKQQAMVEKQAYMSHKPDIWVNPSADVDDDHEDVAVSPDAKRAESMGIPLTLMKPDPEATHKQREAAKSVAASRRQSLRTDEASELTPVVPFHPLSPKAKAKPHIPTLPLPIPNMNPYSASLADGSSHSNSSQPIVVLDLPAHTARQVQADIRYNAVKGPRVIENELINAGGDMSSLPVDHELPEEDPLLPAVHSHLHRLAGLMRQQDANTLTGEVEDEVRSSRRKTNRRRRTNPAAVADLPTSSSTELQLDIRSDESESSIPFESDSTLPVSIGSSQSQLIPMECPTCSKLIQLVDTGAPQMYTCPYCESTFIM